MTDYPMTVHGKAVPGDSTFPVINPTTGEVFAQAPDCSDTDLADAVASSLAAYQDWRRDDSYRRTVLTAVGEALRGAAQELGAILTREQGKPLLESVQEIGFASYWFDYYAGLEVEDEVLQDDEQARIEVFRQPIGPVAAITPWNFPILLSLWKIAPALRAGNTVVLKPSPYTPLAALRMGQILSRVTPAGSFERHNGRRPARRQTRWTPRHS